MILKNVAGQGVYLYAVDTTTSPYGPKTGDAANITGYRSLDGTVTGTVFGTTHPTEVDATHMKGIYWQPLSQAETNGNELAFSWASTTSGVFVQPILRESISNLLDEVNTGATHNVNGSWGKQLRLINPNSEVIYSSTLASQAGVTSTQVKLDSGASAVDGTYVGDVLSVVSGTGQGSRICTAYTGSTRLATVNSAWTVAPISGDVVEVTPAGFTEVVGYLSGQDPATLVWAAAARTLTAFSFSVALAANQHVIVDSGTVTTLTNLPSIPANWLTAAGINSGALNGKGDWLLATGVPSNFSSMVISTSGIVTAVDASAVAIDTVQAGPAPTTTAFAGTSALSATDNFYNGSVVAFTSGALKGIARKITGYTGATRLIATAATPVVSTAGDHFVILGRID